MAKIYSHYDGKTKRWVKLTEIDEKKPKAAKLSKSLKPEPKPEETSQ